MNRTRGAGALAGLVVLAAAAVVGTAVGAQAAPARTAARDAAGPTITVDRTRVRSGQTVTVSGAGCTAGSSPSTVALSLAIATQPTTVVQTATVPTVAADGSWSFPLTIAPHLFAENYFVDATCDGATSFAYTPVQIVITPETVAVEPTVVAVDGAHVALSYGGFRPGEVVYQWQAVGPVGATWSRADANGVAHALLIIGKVPPGDYQMQVVDSPTTHEAVIPVEVVASPVIGPSALYLTPGQPSHLTARGFQPGEAIDAYFLQAGGELVGRATADGTGSADVVVTIPPGTPVGTRELDLVGSTGRVVRYTVDVEAAVVVTPEQAPSAPVAPTSSLPFTGASHTTALTGTGLALLVGGAGAFAVGRRRRTS